MSRNEDVTTAIWVDLMDVAPDSKLLYVWSFTNEHNGMSGLYRIHERIIAVETGLDHERLNAALNELAEHRFMFYEDGVIWVRARVKRLRSRTSQIAKSIAKDLRNIGSDHPLAVRFLEVYRGEKWLQSALEDLNLIRTSSEPQADPHPQGESVRFAGTSGEVPLSGEGLSSSTSNVSKPKALNVNVPEKRDEDDARAKLPADFPSELEPHVDAVLPILVDLAVRHGAKAVSRLSLASVIMARRHKPLAQAAHDYVAWADGQAQRRKDVLAGYRNWLDRTNDLAGTEQLGAWQPVVARHPALERMEAYKQ